MWIAGQQSPVSHCVGLPLHPTAGPTTMHHAPCNFCAPLSGRRDVGGNDIGGFHQVVTASEHNQPPCLISHDDKNSDIHACVPPVKNQAPGTAGQPVIASTRGSTHPHTIVYDWFAQLWWKMLGTGSTMARRTDQAMHTPCLPDCTCLPSHTQPTSHIPALPHHAAQSLTHSHTTSLSHRAAP
jgi:hypothetical protein